MILHGIHGTIHDGRNNSKLQASDYSSDLSRAAGLVTLTPKTFALKQKRSVQGVLGNARLQTHRSKMTVRLRLLTL